MNQFQHASDYLRVIYKRRWIAGAAFLLVFAYSATSSLRKTPIYEASTQLLIEKESQRAPLINAMMQASDAWFDDDFYQTQYRMMQSRALAWRTLEAMGLGPAADRRRAAGAGGRGALASQTGWLGKVASLLGAPKVIAPPAGDETSWQSDSHRRLPGRLERRARPQQPAGRRPLSSPPIPAFAAKAANAVAEAYIAQGLSFRALASAGCQQLPQHATGGAEAETRGQRAGAPGVQGAARRRRADRSAEQHHRPEAGGHQRRADAGAQRAPGEGAAVPDAGQPAAGPGASWRRSRPFSRTSRSRA